MTAALVLATLTGCGGGGSGGSSTTPPPPPPPPPPPAADTTPPPTSLDSQPEPVIATTSATFTFSSEDTTATFQYSLNGGAYANAVSPLTLTGLEDGAYTISIRARDPAGNVDATPATTGWTVAARDTTAPETTLNSGPSGTVLLPVAVFSFTSDDPDATFQYNLDNGAWLNAVSPLTLTAVNDGYHSVLIRARDAAGNIDASPTISTWTVDALAPDTVIVNPPQAITRSREAQFQFHATKPNATFEVTVDGGAPTTQGSSFTLANLTDGTHELSVRALDEHGFPDPSPATFRWAVDRTAPSARILFPTTVSYTDAGIIAVRGVADDANAVGDVTVNGIPATTLDGYRHWRVDVPLVAGENTLSVEVSDSVGNQASNVSSVRVTRGATPVFNMRGIGYEWLGLGRLIVADATTNVIYAVQPSDGSMQVISSAAQAVPGASNYRNDQLILDIANSRVLLLDSGLDALVAVDVATGIRTIVAPASLSAPTTRFTRHSPFTLGTNNRVFVVDHYDGHVIEVDLATGARAVAAPPGGFPEADTVIYDDVTNPGDPRLLISNDVYGDGQFEQIDSLVLSSGFRQPLSSANAPSFGTGPTLTGGRAMVMDANNRRVLVLSGTGQHLYAVSLDTGNRSIVFTNPTVPAGTTPVIESMAFDQMGRRLFLVRDQQEIIEVDMQSWQRRSVASSRAGFGREVEDPAGVIVEQRSGSAGSLLYSDQWQGEVVRVNLASGARTIVSKAGVTGTGPSLEGVVDLVLDTRNPHLWYDSAIALVADPLYALVSVNLTTGERSSIATLGIAPGSTGQPRNLRFDGARNRVLFSVTSYVDDTDALYAVDLTTGVRTTLTAVNQGSGPWFMYASNFALDSLENPTRAFVAEEGPGGMLSVDLATGNRSSLFGAWPEDPQPGSSVASATWMDEEGNRLLALRAGSTSNLFSVSLATGTQRVLSGENPAAANPADQLIGRGPIPYGAFSMEVREGVAFAAGTWAGMIYAIDTISGDRVIIAR